LEIQVKIPSIEEFYIFQLIYFKNCREFSLIGNQSNGIELTSLLRIANSQVTRTFSSGLIELAENSPN